jgi:hypothetical protein
MIPWFVWGYFLTQHKETTVARRIVRFQNISNSLNTTTAYLAYMEYALLASNIHRAAKRPKQTVTPLREFTPLFKWEQPQRCYTAMEMSL